MFNNELSARNNESTRFTKEATLKDNHKISISPIEVINEDEWEEFLQSASESTYFCTTDWWSTFENSYVLQVRDQNDELVGGVPFRILSVLPIIGKYFQFSWLDSSVLIKDSYSSTQVLSIKREAFKYLIHYLNKTNVIVMTISSKSQSKDEELFRELFNSSEKCATLIVDLNRDDESIFSAFEKRKRNSIRKATKIGVEIKIMEGKSGHQLIPDYCVLQNKMFIHKVNSYSNIYTKSKDHLKSILSSNAKTYIAMAYYEGQPVVGNILVSHKKNIYAYLGASDNMLNRVTNASTLLEYECMLHAKNLGYLNYDLGGIPVKAPNKTDGLYGVYLYKKGFGGERYVFDCTGYTLRKYRYSFVWWLRKFETNSLAVKTYSILQKKKS